MTRTPTAPVCRERDFRPAVKAICGKNPEQWKALEKKNERERIAALHAQEVRARRADGEQG